MQLGKNRVDTGNAVASSPQPRNRLGKGRDEDDTLPTYMWKKKQEGKEKKVRKTEKNKDKEVLRELVPRRF